ncbi:hypothetical protein JX266_014376, partial [Neoarthrinium moseri]
MRITTHHEGISASSSRSTDNGMSFSARKQISFRYPAAAEHLWAMRRDEMSQVVAIGLAVSRRYRGPQSLGSGALS